MNEEKQKEPTLEDKLLGIASFTDISEELDKAKTPGEQADVYKTAATMISGQGEGDDNYDSLIKELTRDPAYASIEINGFRDNLARSIEKEYSENKEKITKDIQSKIDASLKEVGDDKATASMIVAKYLTDILNVQEFTQEEVDNLERQKVLTMGLPYAFEARGSIEQYRNLELRAKASEYLKPVKDREKISHYEIDYKKLSKAMEDVVTGASLYATVTTIEKVKEKIKEKQKKK